MAPSSVRALHYVLKVADRSATFRFLHEVLGMHVLRHEEFRTGCAAACNGPYDGMWSKTMMGYAGEDTSFVLELTYNYGVHSYRRGNGFGFLKIRNRVAYKNLEEQGLGHEVDFNVRDVQSPDGDTFRVLNEDPTDVGCLASLCLHVTDLDRSLAFWADTLGFLEVDKGDGFLVMACGADQATLRLKQLPAGASIDHGTGFGRVAFSCPAADLAGLQEEVRSRGYRVLTPLVSLDTPGKAAVQVVILADPDGHEICFVGDEAFRELAREDDNALQLLMQAMSRDSSRDWAAGRGQQRAVGPPKAGVAAAQPAAKAAIGAGSPPAAQPAGAAPVSPTAAAPAAAPAAAGKAPTGSPQAAAAK